MIIIGLIFIFTVFQDKIQFQSLDPILGIESKLRKEMLKTNLLQYPEYSQRI